MQTQKDPMQSDNNWSRINHSQPGVKFPKKDKNKSLNTLMSEYDKRINDILHRIEFTDATDGEKCKLYMKLQMFLRKRRALKSTNGHIYVPRTESGNYIINGKVTKNKKG